jgi:dienelactone hydrolase
VRSLTYSAHLKRVTVLLLFAVAMTAWSTAPVGAGQVPAVHFRILRLVDRSRRAHFRDGRSGPRVLQTEVRYPTVGRPPFPLIVFAHGFAETPDAYLRMLDTWARAGYVVAAPIFPVESPRAPGGPDESDLGNEPGDMSFVISRLTARESPMRGLVDARKIAVAGQSDGAEAALSIAYDRRFRDPRVAAAIILSGAAFPGFSQPPPSAPPLLAVQGTLDPLNSPSTTAYYFRLMRRPKFLLWLVGAPHLEPYTTSDRWAPVVRGTTTAFFNHYLRDAPRRLLIDAARRAGHVAELTADP